MDIPPKMVVDLPSDFYPKQVAVLFNFPIRGSICRRKFSRFSRFTLFFLIFPLRLRSSDSRSPAPARLGTRSPCFHT